ncbi:MAG: HIT family protein [Promethearchaeota archaeon]
MVESECIFCGIIKKRIPSKIIYEDEFSMAFLDIFPISRGHTIIVPKKHYANLEEIPDNELGNLIVVVKKIANILRKKLNFDGYNILQNNFKAAGQDIFHIHFHIIPRTCNDNKFYLQIPKQQASEEELDEILELITN